MRERNTWLSYNSLRTHTPNPYSHERGVANILTNLLIFCYRMVIG